MLHQRFLFLTIGLLAQLIVDALSYELCGALYQLNSADELKRPVVLQSVNVTADIRAWVAGVTADLAYKNTLNQAIEVEFVFPLYDSAAVYKLEAEFENGRRLKAEIKARDEATDIYNRAVASGNQAALLQNQKGTTDVYRLLLGNLRPNETAVVTVGWAQPMDRDPENAIMSISLPVVLNPRYMPLEDLEDIESFLEHYQSSTPFVAVSSVSYTMNFAARVDLGLDGEIVEIKTGNASDVIQVTKVNKAKSASVALTSNFVPDHDFSLHIRTEKALKPKIYVEPGLETANLSNWLSHHVAAAWFEPIPINSTIESKDEYWLIIDQSGSMAGDKIVSAREALLFFVRSLPFGCTFNIIGFGSNYQPLFRRGQVPYNETTQLFAVNHVQNIDANLGGTEILEPLDFVYRQPAPTRTGALRFIIVLTDGEVSNTNQVLANAARHADKFRIFSIGIGSGASTALVDGLARNGRGMADYVLNPSDRLSTKVINMLKATTSPIADMLVLNWTVSGGQVLYKEPSSVPQQAFFGRSISQYAVLRKSLKTMTGSVTMTSKMNGELKLNQLNFNISSKELMTSGDEDSMPLHRLAAKARLANLTDMYRQFKRDSFKTEAIQLSIESGVLCDFTAFVAIDADSKVQFNDSTGKPLRVTIERPTIYREPESSYYNYNPPVLSSFRIMSGGSAITYDQDDMAFYEDSSDSADYSLLAGVNRGPPTVPATTQRQMARTVTTTVRPNVAPLLNLQTFEGSWILDQRLVTTLASSSASTVQQMRSVLNSNIKPALRDDKLYGTIAALAALRNRFASNRNEWSVLELKAVAFLTKNGLTSAQIDIKVAAAARALAF